MYIIEKSNVQYIDVQGINLFFSKKKLIKIYEAMELLN